MQAFIHQGRWLATSECALHLCNGWDLPSIITMRNTVWSIANMLCIFLQERQIQCGCITVYLGVVCVAWQHNIIAGAADWPMYSAITPQLECSDWIPRVEVSLSKILDTNQRGKWRERHHFGLSIRYIKSTHQCILLYLGHICLRHYSNTLVCTRISRPY